VLGGTSLAGGKGRIVGTLIGALILVLSYCFLLSTSTASKITTALTIIW
jgi:ribose/xylose/arabinose/galactoside ABC-type transport system permease subunit